MYRKSLAEKCLDLVAVIALPTAAGFILLVAIGGPIYAWYSAGVTQKAINEQCGTHYSRVDILLSEDKLTQLCKIKNQEILLK